jgi:polysaccharide biosynthesis/export protein
VNTPFPHRSIAALLLSSCLTVPAFAQAPSTAKSAAPSAAVSTAAVVSATPDYVIGPDDILTIVFWREKELSAEVAVRPDGKISLPLLNEVSAAGSTPEQLRVVLTEQAAKFVEEPTVSVVVKQINSRKVYITGNISKPGTYPLSSGPTTVLQLIAMAGGVLEYSEADNISILRQENGRLVSYRFNYEDVKRRKKLGQNILLQPNDTVVVP